MITIFRVHTTRLFHLPVDSGQLYTEKNFKFKNGSILKNIDRTEDVVRMYTHTRWKET